LKKQKIEDLAIFGGPKAFNEKLHVGRPNIGNKDQLMQRVSDVLDSGWLTNNGPYVKEFERRLSEYLGVKHCLAVCNATLALEIAARALGFKGEVILPSFTFIASAHAMKWINITPVFCDIDPNTHNIDPLKIEELITPQTTGILGVHVWGQPCDIKSIKKIAEKYNLKVLYDAAHGLGSSYQGRKIGGFGEAEVFSFHATKFFNTLEGGAITTNSDRVANKIRLLRNFGFYGLDNVVELGTNGKMNEISAAMGLTSLDSIDEFIATNKRNYDCYRSELNDIHGLRIIHYDENERSNFQYIVLEVDENKSGINRDKLVHVLHAENILARRYFYPGCHQLEPYRTLYPEVGKRLHETEILVERVMCLPNGKAINISDIKQISKIIQFTLDHSERISELLSHENNRSGK